MPVLSRYTATLTVPAHGGKGLGLVFDDQDGLVFVSLERPNNRAPALRHGDTVRHGQLRREQGAAGRGESRAEYIYLPLRSARASDAVTNEGEGTERIMLDGVSRLDEPHKQTESLARAVGSPDLTGGHGLRPCIWTL